MVLIEKREFFLLELYVYMYAAILLWELSSKHILWEQVPGAHMDQPMMNLPPSLSNLQWIRPIGAHPNLTLIQLLLLDQKTFFFPYAFTVDLWDLKTHILKDLVLLIFGTSIIHE